MPHPYWPLFDLRIRTPRLVLVYPDDALVVRLAALAAKGVHDPDHMPFLHPWTDRPPGELERGTLQYHWRNRAAWTPASWSCDFVATVDGEPVGTQGLTANEFATLRTFETGSWLGRSHQGQGLGKEMRAAILHFGFAGLNAEIAFTGAFEDNAASLGVTRTLGYESNGEAYEVRRGQRARQLRFLMRHDDWEQRRRDDIEIDGLDDVIEFFVGPAAS